MGFQQGDGLQSLWLNVVTWEKGEEGGKDPGMDTGAGAFSGDPGW